MIVFSDLLLTGKWTRTLTTETVAASNSVPANSLQNRTLVRDRSGHFFCLLISCSRTVVCIALRTLSRLPACVTSYSANGKNVAFSALSLIYAKVIVGSLRKFFHAAQEIFMVSSGTGRILARILRSASERYLT